MQVNAVSPVALTLFLWKRPSTAQTANADAIVPRSTVVLISAPGQQPPLRNTDDQTACAFSARQSLKLRSYFCCAAVRLVRSPTTNNRFRLITERHAHHQLGTTRIALDELDR